MANYNWHTTLKLFLLGYTACLLASALPANTTSAYGSGELTSLICASSANTMTAQLVSPANGDTFAAPTINVSTKVSWGTHLDIKLNGNLVTSTSLSDSANEIVILPVGLLTQGTNTITVQATGGCPEATITLPVTITYAPNAASVTQSITNTRSPQLTGRVTNSTALVKLLIAGKWYTATNNGDGTWTLPADVITPDLVDGTYDVRVVTEDPNDHHVLSNILVHGALIIDTHPATGTLQTIQASSRSPELRGTVSKHAASVYITINGHTYTATNNGDGTWTLPAGTLAALANGIYPVTLQFIDLAGNSSTASAQLTVNVPVTIGNVFFPLVPNTGFLRIGSLNIQWWAFYSGFVLFAIVVIGRAIYKKHR